MASTQKTARQERKAKMVRTVALIACAALLLSTYLVYFAGLR